ncbi:M16 family metallopeptidase [Xanthovirga aplysinae]|uniref:M16 family metallopeptidase n=1 Tax=Xanthovirga aplysinae TaxID=2529853 RepID=UPI0012BBE19F|nr:pitrilysin family protein [Xanthovirga aplysinae]MTI30579.1 insulinase family protein [Xanthovirga aplysinae]
MNKRLIYLFSLLFLVSTQLSAQIDRTKAPEPGPAPKINLGEYKSFHLKNGLQVFVVENHKTPRVSLQVALDRDPVMEGEKVGYLSMVGSLMRAGTTNRTKEQLDEEVDFIGGSLSASSTGVYASSLTKHLDKITELMSDVLLHPSFPQEELDKEVKQTISALATEKDDPNAMGANVRAVLNFGKDHPYGELETEETVGKISRDDILNYYKEYLHPEKSYLIIVGDINLKNAKKLAKKYFGGWERGNIPSTTYHEPKAPASTKIAIVNKPGAVQSVIGVTYPVQLKPGSEDAIKASVMNSVLGGSFSARLSQNLREDKGFTYGSYSSLSSDRLVGDFNASASVRTEVTDSAVVEFLYELNRIRDEKVGEEELKKVISEMTGSFARSLERPQTVARFALRTAMYNLPEDYYETYLQKLGAVTPEDIQEMAKKYILPNNANIVIVGDAKKIAPGLEKIAEVKYYDMYGNEVEAPKTELPADLTAEKVLLDYINAIGGVEAIKAIKDSKVQMKASVQGMELEMNFINKAPNKKSSVTSMNGMELQKQVFDGENGVMIARGQQIPMDENQVKDLSIDALFVPELEYEALGVKTSLQGIERVADSDAYAVEVELPSGTVSIHYFDVKSGLKVRQQSSVKTDQGEMTMNTDLENYKEVGGIKFPYTIVIPMGPQKVKAEVVDVKFNTGVSDEVFETK